MKVLGFGHRKRVGKDTATRFAILYLRQIRPDLNTAVLSFGNVIKEIAYDMYSWGGLERAAHYENHPSEIEENLPMIGKSPRQIWDTIGLMGREISDKTWVELAMRRVDADILVCKDVRGLHELDVIRQCGGCSIRLIRDGVPRGGPVDEILANADWDIDLRNNGDLRELNLNVKSIIDSCLERWFPTSKE